MRERFVCDAVFRFVQPRVSYQVYAFSGGKVKVANKRFSSLNAEYELNFDSSTQCNPISDDSRIGSAM